MRIGRKRIQLLLEGKEEEVTRRTFFGTLGWSGLLLSMGVAAATGFRFMFPNVLFEPSSIIKLGKPDSFPNGVTFLSEPRLFVFKNKGSFHIISAVCTHLGCTVKKLSNGFNCPCHGSKFDVRGNVLSGPAPRPLEWFEVKLAPNGDLVVYKMKPVEQGFSLKA